MRYKKLSDICGFVKGKIDIASLTQDTYISTENMLANKAGIVAAAMLPIAAQTQRYEKGDVLISNIRRTLRKFGIVFMMAAVQTMFLYLEQKKMFHQSFYTMCCQMINFLTMQQQPLKGQKCLVEIKGRLWNMMCLILVSKTSKELHRY